MKATKFYELYCEWFDSCNFNTKVVYKTKFGLELKDIEVIEKNRCNDGIYYAIDKNELLAYLQENELYDEYA